jgi:hypothetical protein
MELVSLDIERFGCVGRAQITFRAGLNVLHGANEAGKSSIARAIRFALLLPSASNAVEPWVPWTSGGDPAVTLVIKNGIDYYRVKKVFGTNMASLERSSDGIGWANLARAREVEARLRALLQWGIPEPGGAKATKGLPESFLASALLADQDQVASIFERDLERDGVDSGRVRVGAALQAMAQDPLFKSVLDAAQARMDEAFTPGGKQSWAASSPLKKMSDDVNKRRDERDEADQIATSSRLLAQRVTELQRDTAITEGNLQEQTTQREALEQRRARQSAFAKASADLRAGQVLVDAVTEAERKVKEARDALVDLELRVPILLQAEQQARKIFEATTADASAAREKRKGELAQEETAILRGREALRIRKAHLDVALDLQKADDLRERGTNVEQKLEMLEHEIKVLEGVEPWTDLQATKGSLDAANQKETRARDIAAKVANLLARAAMEWPGATSSGLPDARRLTELRTLHNKLEMTEAKLDVGVSVEVRGTHSAIVSVDGAAKGTRTSPFVIEAKKSAELDLGGGIEVWVRGGQAAHRQEAERLRKEWHDTTASLFATLGVADFSALEETCRLDSERKATAMALAREADWADAERTALGDPAAEKAGLSVRIAELEARIQGTDIGLIEAAATSHGSKVRTVLTKTTAERDSQRSELATLRAQEVAMRQRAAAHAGGSPISDVDAEVRALTQAAQDLDQRETTMDDERKVLEAPPSKDDSLAEAAAKAKTELEDALAKAASSTTDRDSWNARLQERRVAVADVDIMALTRTEEATRVASRDDGAPVDDAAIATARKAEETTKRDLETLVNELRKAEGALQASGGAAADERVRELNQAFQRAHEKQVALEDEYEAWKLLAETLKDAERDQATHLGNVLAPDMVSRLQALAGQRYSGIALSPHLGLEGIDVAGGRRELERLSIGTREQISTLFRLCLAERLRSALLLDDQLVQSDPDRLRWFRRALRQTATTGVQVVVLTCRPDDYLEPAETPPPHVIDLSAVITR